MTPDEMRVDWKRWWRGVCIRAIEAGKSDDEIMAAILSCKRMQCRELLAIVRQEHEGRVKEVA